MRVGPINEGFSCLFWWFGNMLWIFWPIKTQSSPVLILFSCHSNFVLSCIIYILVFLQIVLDSDESTFGGFNRIAHTAEYFTVVRLFSYAHSPSPFDSFSPIIYKLQMLNPYVIICRTDGTMSGLILSNYMHLVEQLWSML